MKRMSMWAIAIVVLVVMTLVFSRAHALERRVWRGPSWHHPGPISYLAHGLKLSDAQRAQIQSLWLMEQPTIAARIQELIAENKEMNAISVGENPDKRKIQAIASRESVTIAALLSEKEQLQSKIYGSVLSPEQRAKADELQKKWEFRLDRAADRFGTKSEK